ncbi:MAG: hypothetical protein JO261_11545 [Alphaproteobacteria bacterium]|nr:hypothetical protein [Alphaproteobacteria bacterium]MBV9694322.1 hypothetical protein [Alphaproteobacteria bacterium]
MRFVLSCALGCALALSAGAAQAAKANAKASPQTACNGTFSNGVAIAVGQAAYMPDVGYIDKTTPAIGASAQTSCDVFTFAWNQFLYWTQSAPGTTAARFMTMAPWYNALTTGAKPGAYPGGSTALQTAYLDLGQAGDQDELLDVAGNPVAYDIRFDVNMYNSIVLQNLYTQNNYNAACQPNPSVCNNQNIWMTPAGANERPEPGSTEVKTAWRDYLTPQACPSSQYFCQGRFALIGFHFVNKTFSHGEWIWASFEHVANAPDCAPGGDTPIAQQSPLGTSWSFFNPSAVPPGVMSSKTCSVTANPQCNANPNPSGDGSTWVKINVCRTDAIAAGGASAANCNPATPNNTAGNVACLNATIMPKLSGVWKNYKLVGAVWTQGGMGPNQDFRIQVFQQQVQGLPYPAPSGFVHLANTVVETWMQKGSTGYDPFGTNATTAGCFSCHHEPASATQVDLSHFPGKLPAATLHALRSSLIPANSTAKPRNLVRAPRIKASH